MAQRIVKPGQRYGKVVETRTFPQSRAIEQYAFAILSDAFGDLDWIPQAAKVVGMAADRAITHLSQSAVTQNSAPLGVDTYAFPARSKEELLATKNLVADEASVGKKARNPEIPDVEEEPRLTPTAKMRQERGRTPEEIEEIRRSLANGHRDIPSKRAPKQSKDWIM